MGKPLLPAVYVNAPVCLVYGDLPRSIALTGIRIWGLGWRYRYERSAPIAEGVLREICGLSRRQLYEHLARLMATGVLRYSNTGGQFTFHFDPAQRSRAGPSAENRTDWALGVVVVPDSLSGDSLDSRKEKQQQHIVPSLGGECEGGEGECGFPHWEDRLAAMDEMGVLPPVREELAGQQGQGYLWEWAEWLTTQDALGVGWAVQRMRAGDRAPRLSREQRVRLSLREVVK